MIGNQSINTKTIAFVGCVGWFMVAWAIDKFWFTVFARSAPRYVAFEFELTAKDLVHLKTDRVSAIFLFVVQFVANFFYLAPYRALRQRSAWMKLSATGVSQSLG